MEANSNRFYRLIGAMIMAEIFSLIGFSTFAVTLVEFTRIWRINASQAGWISGSYFIGYVAASPLLIGLTDRFDTRRIYALASLLGIAGGLGFAWLAEGQAGAMLFRALAGASLAGTYMPGLRILTERLDGPARLRVVPYYTASFGIGVSLSFLVSGWLAQLLTWRGAFAFSSFCSAAALGCMLLSTVGIAQPPPAFNGGTRRHPLDLRPAFKNKEALAYILAYCGHCWELFGLRAWLPAYLLFAWQQSHQTPVGTLASKWATLIVLIGVPASILGAEAASRYGRSRLIRYICVASCATGLATAIVGSFSYAVAIAALFGYNFFITADSGALTAGAVAAARPGEQGATLAVHSLLGFLGGGAGPVAVGWGLNLFGGIAGGQAWLAAFGLMSAGSAAAILAISTRWGTSRQWIEENQH